MEGLDICKPDRLVSERVAHDNSRLLLTVPNNNHVRYFATFCITSGTYTVIGIMIAWCKVSPHYYPLLLTRPLVAHNLGSETKKATGIPMYMAIGQCGSVLGSHLFPSTEGPRYIKGFAVSCALEFLAAICGVILSVSRRSHATLLTCSLTLWRALRSTSGWRTSEEIVYTEYQNVTHL